MGVVAQSGDQPRLSMENSRNFVIYTNKIGSSVQRELLTDALQMPVQSEHKGIYLMPQQDQVN